MVRLMGERIYLAALEREDCRTLYRTDEYDFAARTDRLMFASLEGADKWFDDIQRDQNTKHVRLGIFLHSGGVIGDIALQDIDWHDAKCSLGQGIAAIARRGQGYGREAAALMLAYAFDNLGLERVEATTLSPNIAAQRSLEAAGFRLEGRQREAIRIGGARVDKLLYGMLANEYRNREETAQ